MERIVNNVDNNLENLPAIKWGRNHEKKALTYFFAKEAVKHQNAKIKECGIFMDKNKPYLAASPDGIFSCKCH